MNSTLSKILMFTAGAAIGSAVTWKLVKTKYERIAQEEIESVRELYSESDSDELENDTNIAKKPDIRELAAKLMENGYTNYSDTTPSDDEQEEESNMSKPRVIPPEEFDELDDYGTVSLTCYADKVVTINNVEKNCEELLEDVDGTIGLESLEHFGEYEDDSVFVRNDELKCDYEILLDSRRYSDIENTDPQDAEDE